MTENIMNIDQKIESMRQKWYSQVKELGQMADDLAYEYLTYTFVVIIMIFFLYIILSNLYSTFKFHEMLNKDARHESYRNNSINRAKLDNNEFSQEFDPFYNTNEYILDNLQRNDQNVKQRFQRLLEFKRRNNIDSDLHINIDQNVISNKVDNYAYPDKVKNTPFLEMLFSEPNYNQLNRIN